MTTLPTTTQIIDGKAIAGALRKTLAQRAGELRARGVVPRLDVILVGEHGPSLIYVQNKRRAAAEVGIDATIHALPEKTTQDVVLRLIERLNHQGTHGILLQLPLPAHLDPLPLLNAIAPERDVDGLNLYSAGCRTLGLNSVLPCTPKGCITLLKSVRRDLSGLHALVIGRSNLVGAPMAQLLLREDCTVTIAHSRTVNLPELCRQADIVVAAIGKPHFVKADWLKPQAIILDVGINRLDGRVTGDVDFDAVMALPAEKSVRAITPVPGGVGPMTIASLLENTLDAAELAALKNAQG